MLNPAHEQEDQGGTAYRGMSVEQGVAHDIKWACGPDAASPRCPSQKGATVNALAAARKRSK